jgi:nitrate/nitrite-specific signal transduction histidine kinase
MSTLFQAAEGLTLKSRALLFFALTVLLTLLAVVGVLYERGSTLILLSFLLAIQVVTFFFFHHYVLQPLSALLTATRQMTDGHLDSLIRIARKDEIGRLGESINDLTVNMQEVLLFIWNHSQQSRELLEHTTRQLDTPDSLSTARDDLEKMWQNNEDLRAIVLSFSYFEIRLEHERMLADSDCSDDEQHWEK